MEKKLDYEAVIVYDISIGIDGLRNLIIALNLLDVYELSRLKPSLAWEKA